jgi:hypothetical protein
MKRMQLCFFVFAALLSSNCVASGVNYYDFTWSESLSGLKLGVSAEGSVLRMALENVSKADIVVFSHVLTYEWHYDWFTVRIHSKDAVINSMDTRYIRIGLTDERDKSAAVTDTLSPGEILVHKVNLYDWMHRNVNNNLNLNGEYQLTLTYMNEECKNCSEEYRRIWTGYLETPPVNVNFQKEQLLKLHVRITDVLPVGWGIIYRALIIEESDGQSHDFGSEINFGFLAGKIELPAETELVLHMKKTKELAVSKTQMPCNCAIDKENAVWEISGEYVFIDTGIDKGQ